MRLLGEAGVPCGAVLDTQDIYEDPHLNARGFVKTVEHQEWGEVQLLGWPPRMSESEVELVGSPLLGQHTHEVLTGDLGLGDAELAGTGGGGRHRLTTRKRPGEVQCGETSGNGGFARASDPPS